MANRRQGPEEQTEEDGTRPRLRLALSYPSLAADDTSGNRVKCRQRDAFLYQAALKGDWKAAKPILRADTSLASHPITQDHDTVLHIAAVAKRTKFVREVVKLMGSKELEAQNKDGDTAFCFAAASGVVKIAEVMYDKNKSLPTIRGTRGMSALYMAAVLGHKEMVSYLYPVSRDLEYKERAELFEATTDIDMFDLALAEAEHLCDSDLDTREAALRILARKPSVMVSHNKEWMWKRFASITRSLRYIPCMKTIHDYVLIQIGANRLVQKLLDDILKLDAPRIDKPLKATGILMDAVKVGNVEFLDMVFRLYPEVITSKDENDHSIFHVAVLHRQENVFKLIYDIGAYKDLIALDVDKEGNNILHLAGKRPAQDRLEAVSGAALQMQRELLWFKEVEKMVPPSYLQMRNKKNQTRRSETPRESGQTSRSETPTEPAQTPRSETSQTPRSETPIEPDQTPRSETPTEPTEPGQTPRSETATEPDQTSSETLIEPGQTSSETLTEPGQTPGEVFSKEHKELLEKGEKWMTDTANYCMLVATLIATVAFAAAFTVPGGSNGDTGIPIFLKATWFDVFVISDVVGMFTSTISIILFLSILTSRYAEDDFLAALPTKLIFGLAALFFAIVSMVVAFASAYFLIYKYQRVWTPRLIVAFTSIPIILFLLLQCKLWFDTIRSTLRSKFQFRPSKYKLY